METKPFTLRCKCGWIEMSTGSADDLKHLKEVRSGCSSCGKPRVFRCLRCSGNVKMLRTANIRNK